MESNHCREIIEQRHFYKTTISLKQRLWNMLKIYKQIFWDNKNAVSTFSLESDLTNFI